MEQIVERLRAASPAAFTGTPVIFAYVFGSTARGDSRPGSDVDVAVYLEAEADAGDSIELMLKLAGKLASASSVGKIEVVSLNVAPLALRGRAVRERAVIYSRDEPARVEFESLTLREFFDFQIHAVPLDQALLRRMAEGHR